MLHLRPTSSTCTFALLLLFLAAPAPPAAAGEGRSSAAVRAFKRAHPCPSTGARHGACPGHVVDHVEPRCAGGRDHPDNMQWQTVAEAKRKDVEEHRRCRALRRARHAPPAVPDLAGGPS